MGDSLFAGSQIPAKPAWVPGAMKHAENHYAVFFDLDFGQKSQDVRHFCASIR